MRHSAQRTVITAAPERRIRNPLAQAEAVDNCQQLVSSAEQMLSNNSSQSGQQGELPSFDELDQNSNGELSRQEFAQVQGLRFSSADNDSDGMVDREEYMQASSGSRQGVSTTDERVSTTDVSVEEQPEPEVRLAQQEDSQRRDAQQRQEPQQQAQATRGADDQ